MISISTMVSSFSSLGRWAQTDLINDVILNICAQDAKSWWPKMGHIGQMPLEMARFADKAMLAGPNAVICEV